MKNFHNFQTDGTTDMRLALNSKNSHAAAQAAAKRPQMDAI